MTALKNIKNSVDAQLMRAINLSDINSAQDAVMRGANVNYEDSFSDNLDIRKTRTPLSLAAFRGNYNIVKWLMEAGADIHSLSYASSGYTALFFAAQEGHFECLRELKESGGSMDADIEQGRFKTALLVATENDSHMREEDRYSLLRYLVEQGSDVNARDEHGFTPLMNILDRNYKNQQGLKLLIDNGAMIDVVNNKGEGLKAVSGQARSPLDHLIIQDKMATYDFIVSYYEESRLSAMLESRDHAAKTLEF